VHPYSLHDWDASVMLAGVTTNQNFEIFVQCILTPMIMIRIGIVVEKICQKKRIVTFW
jgi:hypothetical protein